MSITDYKYKPDKHLFIKNTRTIDETHRNYIDKFQKENDSLVIKKKELENMKNLLTDLSLNATFSNFGRINELKKNINELEKNIYSVENHHSEVNYYGKIGEVLFQYYDITNGMLYGNINDEPKTVSNNNCDDDRPKVKISNELLELTNLNKKKKDKKPKKKRNVTIDEPEKNILSYVKGINLDNDEEMKIKNDNICKSTLQNEYLMMVDKEYACTKVKTPIIKKCKKCNIDKIIIYNDSILTCSKCGESDVIFIESDVPTNRENFTEKPKYPYKRIGHCIEKLNQFLCKGNINIPSSVYNILKEELFKHNIKVDNITIEFIEKMLHKHRLSSYYEYVYYIYCKMTNTKPQTITREERELVIKIFCKAEELYEEKYKPYKRHNFIKYTFILHKIFILIGKEEIANHFKLLKSLIKMKEQEAIWLQICADPEWKF